jgi:membrane fusion protein, multidrug efflux system
MLFSNLKYVAAIGFVLLLGACDRQEKEEEASGPIRPVRVVAAETRATGQTVQFSGTIESQTQVDLAFRIGGRVVERPVSVGDSVEAGQIVARLDPSDEENGMAAAEAALSAADGQLAEARLNYERQRHLYERNVVARAAIDRAEQVLTTAQAAADGAQAQLGIARRRLDETVLYADAPGVVTAVGIEPGEIAAAGRMVARLARDDGKDAVFNIPAATIDANPVNPEVAVAMALSPSTTALGRVREVAPQADASTGTFPVRVGLIDPPAAMRLGSPVTGQITLDGAEGIEIPARALTRSNGEPSVWVVDPNTSKVELRPVEIAHFAPSSVIVSEGLEEGELVVTAGVQALRPGQEVRVPGRDS